MVEDGTHHFSGPEINRKQFENGTHPSQNKKLCLHCNKEFCLNAFVRFHGDNCKLNPLFKNEIKPKVECPHCDRYLSKNMFTRFHNNNCKLKPE